MDEPTTNNVDLWKWTCTPKRHNEGHNYALISGNSCKQSKSEFLNIIDLKY